MTLGPVNSGDTPAIHLGMNLAINTESTHIIPNVIICSKNYNLVSCLIFLSSSRMGISPKAGSPHGHAAICNEPSSIHLSRYVAAPFNPTSHQPRIQNACYVAIAHPQLSLATPSFKARAAASLSRRKWVQARMFDQHCCMLVTPSVSFATPLPFERYLLRLKGVHLVLVIDHEPDRESEDAECQDSEAKRLAHRHWLKLRHQS